ncbi:hypothetical protein H8356DRAFT_1352495 [Neocallimastix lanati (nom. inval.)]|nr:hypothetical protein H8356DRAFT_1352495 [Neocallimastix sp. JGI-2020a]
MNLSSILVVSPWANIHKVPSSVSPFDHLRFFSQDVFTEYVGYANTHTGIYIHVDKFFKTNFLTNMQLPSELELISLDRNWRGIPRKSFACQSANVEHSKKSITMVILSRNINNEDNNIDHEDNKININENKILQKLTLITVLESREFREIGCLGINCQDLIMHGGDFILFRSSYLGKSL